MAEGILFNVAASIFTKIGTLLVEKIGLLWGLQDELEKLQGTVETIKAVLLDAERQYQTSNQVRVWLDSLKGVAYDADDLLDEISTETLRRQHKSGNVVAKEVQLFCSSSNGLVHDLKMAHKIKKIRAKLDDIAANRIKLHLNPTLVEPLIVEHYRKSHSSPPNIFIGRENEKREIMSLLLADHKKNVVVVSIVGIGGLGKTTLSQIVYNDKKVQDQFELKAWVCVSDVFDIKSIVVKMIECFGEPKSNHNSEMETLKNQLCEKVREKKYLIVLDDVWNEDGEEWKMLNDLVMGGSRGSRILVTTRSTKVARVCGTLSPYQLEGLSETQSWDLFHKVAFKKEQAPNEEFEKLGKEIVLKLCGLPLAIRTIGSFLCTEENVSEWRRFNDEELLDLHFEDEKSDPKEKIIETLKLSYNHLPSHLKYCFAYCSLFPKDYVYNAYELINHWKAQCYIDTNWGENGGLKCYRHLLERSFFQEEKYKENWYGGFLTFKMHDFMHDLATSVGGQEIKLVDVDHHTCITGNIRHVSLWGQISMQHLNSLVHQKKARTLIIFAYKLDDKLLCSIVQGMRWLRVLNLRKCSIEKLPNSIDRLEHLREMDLSENDLIEMLPDSVTRLYNLQVLNLDYCGSLKRLPKDMKKLVNLICLGLEGCSNLEGMPQGIGQLTSLEVLQRFILSEKSRSAKVCGGLEQLHGLNKLKGRLLIQDLRSLKTGAQECKEANLKSKPHIQFLELDWGEEHQVEDMSLEEESLDELQPHMNLLKLTLNAYGGQRFSKWFSSLDNLVEIEITNCSNCKYLPPLDGLPSLQILYAWNLTKLEYLIDNNKNTFRSCFFPNLSKLRINECHNLKGWWRITPTIEELLHFQLPCLSELTIGHCHNLMSWMPQLPSLKYLSGTDNKLSITVNPYVEKCILDWEEKPQVTGISLEEESSDELQPPHLNLLKLDLKYYIGEGFPKWIFCLENFVEIDISGCPNCKYLPSLNELPSLQILSISSLNILEYIIDNSENTFRSCFFPKLSKFWIHNCPNLRGWWMNAPRTEELLQYQFPCLSILYIESCPNLRGWMPQLPLLDDLRLESINAELVVEILKVASSTNVKLLRIHEIEDLEYLIDNNENIKDTSMSYFFPKLSSLEVNDCLNLKGWWRIVPTTTGECCQFPCLSELEIRNCPHLKGRMPELPLLETLHIYNCTRELLEEILQPSTCKNVKSLQIRWMDDLEYIINNSENMKETSKSYFFPKLSRLVVSDCLNLKGWWRIEPTTEECCQLPCLSRLTISDCSNLKGWMPQLTL